MATRSRVVMIVLAAIVGVVAGGIFFSRSPQDEPPDVVLPPVDSGLLQWAPRGSLARDDALVQAAIAVWRGGTPQSDLFPSKELATVRPGPDVYLVWAGTIGAGRVVILQSVATDGEPSVAEVGEHGHPAVLTLDVVDHLPATLPPALAITYDGNLEMPSLSPGSGAALIEMLPAPKDVLPSLTGLWHLRRPDQGGDLELLEDHDDGLTASFLQIGDAPIARTPIVMATATNGRAGIAGTLDARGGELVPTFAVVALRDVPEWGPSGRIEGSEFSDLQIAAGATGTTTSTFSATVVATGGGSLPTGNVVTARLLAVLGPDDQPVETLIVVRDEGGTVVCSRLTEVATTAGDAADPMVEPSPGAGQSGEHVRALGGRCASATVGVVATLAAAAPGAGAIELVGDDETTSTGGGAEASIVFRLDLYPATATDTVVARIVGGGGDPVSGYGTSVIMRPLEPPPT